MVTWPMHIVMQKCMNNCNVYTIYCIFKNKTSRKIFSSAPQIITDSQHQKLLQILTKYINNYMSSITNYSRPSKQMFSKHVSECIHACHVRTLWRRHCFRLILSAFNRHIVYVVVHYTKVTIKFTINPNEV